MIFYKLFSGFIVLLISAFLLSSCSAVINEVVNDSKFQDGDYIFVMYRTSESSISVYGVMSIYYMSSDSTVTGSYTTISNKNSILTDDKGGIYGKAKWNLGEANLTFGSSHFQSLYITLHKYIDIINGEWTSGFSSGKIYAFKKNN